MKMNMVQLSRREIKEAFKRNGYESLDFLSHRFYSTSINSIGRTVACYEISYYDDDGNDAIGHLYIERRGNELYGEF